MTERQTAVQPDKSRPPVAGLVVDYIVVSLLSAGTSHGVLQWLGLTWPLFTIVLTTLLLTGLVAVISRRWFIAPLLAALAVIMASVFLRINGRFQEFFQWLGSYALWILTRLRIGPMLPENDRWVVGLRVLLLLLPVLFWFLLIRRIDRLVVHAVVMLFIFTPLMAFYPQAMPGLLLALAGLIMLIPRRFIRQVWRKEPRDVRFSRVPLQLFALLIAIACLLSAQAIIPDQTRSWRWPALIHPLNDIGDFIRQPFGRPRAWAPFEISAYGYRLGGPAIPSNSRVLRISADQPYLLKGSSRSVYTGFSWETTGNSYHRLGSGMWSQVQQLAFGTNLPGGSAGSAFKASFSREISVMIEPFAGGMAPLFSAGRVKSVDLDNSLDYPVYFTNTGDLFVFGGLPRGMAYRVTAAYFDRGIPGFDESMRNLEPLAASGRDDSWDAVRSAYLQLPEQLPERVRESARSVASEAASPYQQALELERYLRENFQYTLTPDEDPDANDFVDGFLATGEGYCVHFATAMVVMARTLDIPARYVEGFAPGPIDDDPRSRDRWLAAGTGAHAWAELYFQGIGWLTFDPTPGGQGNEPDEPTPTLTVTPVISPDVTLSPLSPTPAPDPGSRTGTAALLFGIVIALGLLVLALRLLPVAAGAHHRRLFHQPWIVRHHPLPADRMNFYYNDMLRQLDCLDIQPETGETLWDFAGRADQYLKFENMRLTDVLWPVIRWRYGEAEPSEADLDGLAAIHQQLETRLSESMGRKNHFLSRILRTWRIR